MNLRSLAMLCLLVLFGLASLCTAQTREDAQELYEKMQELAKMVSAPEYVGRNPNQDLATVRNLKAYRELIQDARKKFAVQIKEGNQPFRNLGTTCDFLEQKLAAFEQGAKDYASQTAIQVDIDHVLKMADLAVQNQAPAFFNEEGDIFRRTIAAKDRLSYLKAIDGESAKTSEKLLQEASAKVALTEQKLLKDIVQQNKAPEDRYQGSDRQKLLGLIESEWMKSGVKSKVLKIGIIGPDWTRESFWEIQNRTLYKIDRSRIQGFILIQLDKETAYRHSIDIYQDHVDGDKLSARFVNDPKQSNSALNQLLISKLK